MGSKSDLLYNVYALYYTYKCVLDNLRRQRSEMWDDGLEGFIGILKGMPESDLFSWCIHNDSEGALHYIHTTACTQVQCDSASNALPSVESCKTIYCKFHDKIVECSQFQGLINTQKRLNDCTSDRNWLICYAAAHAILVVPLVAMLIDSSTRGYYGVATVTMALVIVSVVFTFLSTFMAGFSQGNIESCKEQLKLEELQYFSYIMQPNPVYILNDINTSDSNGLPGVSMDDTESTSALPIQIQEQS